MSSDSHNGWCCHNTGYIDGWNDCFTSKIGIKYKYQIGHRWPLIPENIQFAATGTTVQLNDELFHYVASLLALLAESGAAVG